MTTERVNGILEEFLDLECWNYGLSVVKIPQQAVQGWLALILFTLMLATLWKLRNTLSPSIWIYHAATAVFEYPIAVNSIAVGHLTYHSGDPSYHRIWAYAVWYDLLASGWAIGDSFKLALSCLTFFLCLDRFCAVCIPIQLRNINRSVVAIIATFVSLVIGTSHLWNMIVYYDLARMPDGQYRLRVNGNFKLPSLVAWTNFLSGFTATARLASCGGIFVLSVCTVIGLKKQAKKIHSMSSAAQEEQSRKTKFTKLTLITAMCVLIDHIPWIANRYWALSAYGIGLPTLDLLFKYRSYADIERRAYYGRVSLALYHLAVWATWFLHGIRFLVYLAFDKTMRDGFVKIFRREQQQQYSDHVSERTEAVKETTSL